jgi:ribosomal protein S27E
MRFRRASCGFCHAAKLFWQQPGFVVATAVCGAVIAAFLLVASA